MKKKLSIILVIIAVIYTSCNPNVELEKDYYEITVINNTNVSVKFSIVEGYTLATSSNDFYTQYHNYLSYHGRMEIKQQLLGPKGRISDDGTELNKITLWVDNKKKNCTIFVCKSNTYSGKPDAYINKKQFYLTGNMTITIGADGQIY